MKKLILILTIILFGSILFTRSNAYAVAKSESTPTASPSASQAANEKLNKEIDQLKEKIASHVAELNLVEKRGVLGTVTDSSNNQVTLTDISGNTQFVDVDEI